MYALVCVESFLPNLSVLHLNVVQMLRSYIAESYLTLYFTILEHAAVAAALGTQNSHSETSSDKPQQAGVVRSADPNFTRGHISDNVIATATASPTRPLAASPLEKLLRERSRFVENKENLAVVRGVKLALAFGLEALTHIGNWCEIDAYNGNMRAFRKYKS